MDEQTVSGKSIEVNTGVRLRSFIDRYERLQEEIDELNDDRAELMKEVGGEGFDKKAFKIVIKRRREPEAAAQEDLFVRLYETALLTAEGHEAIDGLMRAGAREAGAKTVVAFAR